MNPQNDLFDYSQSVSAKKEGMELAASHAGDKLRLARELAWKIAVNGDGTVNMDKVGAEMSKYGITTGNWAGSVFKEPCWVFTGIRIRSSRITAHAREIKVWRYQPR